MAEITAQKCSDRRTKLRRVQQLVNELININEQADRVRSQLIADGDDPTTCVNLILAAGGKSSVTSITSNGTIVDEIIEMISANSSNSVGWTYSAES